MKKLAVVAVAIGALLIGGLGVLVAQATVEPAEFVIEIEATGTGVNMVCEQGCAWKELSFDCGEKVPCSSPIDGWGMKEGE